MEETTEDGNSLAAPLIFLIVTVLQFIPRPATFAQAAKLKRIAAAKERELLKKQEFHSKEKKLSYDTYSKAVMILKVFTYLAMVCWFWGAPVAAISQQLLQPFGKALSWRAGNTMNGNIMVGIIPWLILSTRVSKFICQKVLK
ncbi:hypothetical protein HHK36_010455 [Tetracentron sinense]|uniref:Uncharacterized protein n=1 Tax=Tetracentron sinense TaxID=13715 RepID=A0A834ZI32_TETSI|nr:hypothetical protein HHK36_010455 [Tetracentron sinense]